MLDEEVRLNIRQDARWLQFIETMRIRVKNFDSYLYSLAFQTRPSAKPTTTDDFNSATNILVQKPSNQVGHLM